jgi:copper chaperone CopZ
MKIASVNDLKAELSNLTAAELVEICVRLIKYKKDNKELLNYLLFQSYDEQGYIDIVKNELEEAFTEVNRSNLYFAKKTIRKILRLANKYSKHTGSKQVEIELLLYFCTVLKDSGIRIDKNTALNNLYHSQIKKIEKAIAALHEDLQYDYRNELNKLTV